MEQITQNRTLNLVATFTGLEKKFVSQYTEVFVVNLDVSSEHKVSKNHKLCMILFLYLLHLYPKG